jgi:hypothetical protein
MIPLRGSILHTIEIRLICAVLNRKTASHYGQLDGAVPVLLRATWKLRFLLKTSSHQKYGGRYVERKQVSSSGVQLHSNQQGETLQRVLS